MAPVTPHSEQNLRETPGGLLALTVVLPCPGPTTHGRGSHPGIDEEAVAGKSSVLKTWRQGNAMVSSSIPNELGLQGNSFASLGEWETHRPWKLNDSLP